MQITTVLQTIIELQVNKYQLNNMAYLFICIFELAFSLRNILNN